MDNFDYVVVKSRNKRKFNNKKIRKEKNKSNRKAKRKVMLQSAKNNGAKQHYNAI